VAQTAKAQESTTQIDEKTWKAELFILSVGEKSGIVFLYLCCRRCIVYITDQFWSVNTTLLLLTRCFSFLILWESVGMFAFGTC